MNNNEGKILKEIFAKPAYKFHVRELAKITKLNPNTILNIAERLVKEGVLLKEKKRHVTELYFNTENPRAKIKKKMYNLAKVYESGVADFLYEKYVPEAIVLMGSYSRGEDTENSDIDLAIISNKEGHPDLSNYEKFLNRKIHLIVTNYKRMSEEFYINMVNGVVLRGAISKK